MLSPDAVTDCCHQSPWPLAEEYAGLLPADGGLSVVQTPQGRQLLTTKAVRKDAALVRELPLVAWPLEAPSLLFCERCLCLLDHEDHPEPPAEPPAKRGRAAAYGACASCGATWCGACRRAGGGNEDDVAHALLCGGLLGLRAWQRGGPPERREGRVGAEAVARAVVAVAAATKAAMTQGVPLDAAITIGARPFERLQSIPPDHGVAVPGASSEELVTAVRSALREPIEKMLGSAAAEELTDADRVDGLFRRIVLNGLVFEVVGDTGKVLQAGGVFAILCCANHDCDANAEVERPSRDAYVTLKAVKDVQPQSFVHISYCPPDLCWYKRVDALLQWLFICDCPRCYKEWSSLGIDELGGHVARIAASGSFWGAVRILRAALRHHKCGKLYVQMGQLLESIQDSMKCAESQVGLSPEDYYRRAILLSPTCGHAHKLLAESMARRGASSAPLAYSAAACLLPEDTCCATHVFYAKHAAISGSAEPPLSAACENSGGIESVSAREESGKRIRIGITLNVEDVASRGHVAFERHGAVLVPGALGLGTLSALQRLANSSSASAALAHGRALESLSVSGVVADALGGLVSLLWPVLREALSSKLASLVEVGLARIPPETPSQLLRRAVTFPSSPTNTARPARIATVQVQLTNSEGGVDAGCLEVLSGSHCEDVGLGSLDAATANQLGLVALAEQLSAPPGAAAVYSLRALHRHTANTSDRDVIIFFFTVMEHGFEAPPGLPYSIALEDVGQWCVCEQGLVRTA